MKGTERIIAHIQSDAKAEADRILALAQEQCSGILGGYEEQAKAAYAERIRAGVKTCEESIENADRLAQMESRKSLLAVKQEMVSAAFDRAKEMILSMPEEDYLALLTKLAVKAAGGESGEIILNASDRAKYGDSVVSAANAMPGGEKLVLSAETGEFSGGLIVRSGQIETNNTVELLIELCRGDMSSEVAKALFE